MLPWMPWPFFRVSTFGYSDLKRLSPGFTERKWILDTISISNSVTEWRHQSMMDRELAGSPCCWRQQARRCWYHRWKQKVHGLARVNKFTKMGSGVFSCIIGGRGSFRKSYDGRRACWPNMLHLSTKIPTTPQNVSGCRLCNRSVIVGATLQFVCSINASKWLDMHGLWCENRVSER